MSTAGGNRGQKRRPHGDDGGGGKRPAVAPSVEEEDTCWLCLEANHESGLPMRRDCSCRGGSGWAHFPCIVEYAKQKSEQWSNEEDPDYDLTEAWQTCPNCEQDYQNELAINLANEFAAFAEKKYPDDRVVHLESLDLKLKTILNSLVAKQKIQPKQKEEAKVKRE